jgi:hypothetical protein
MGSAVEKLTALRDAKNRYDIPAADLVPVQIEALNERLESRIGVIRLLAHRAESAGTRRIREFADLVPLLFAHTAYKSYPEGWLIEQKWDRLGKWLDTVSTNRVVGVDTNGIRDIDDWIARLEAAGHFVSCSSGTSGKPAMLNASASDMEWSKRETIAAFSWRTGIEPRHDRRMFGLTPIPAVPRNLTIRAAMAEAYGDPNFTPFVYPVPPITIGQITGMVALRRSMADGTAKHADIEAYEKTSKARQEAVDKAIGLSAEALIESRKHKLYLSGFWASLYKIAETVRALGYSGKDFHPENSIYVGGGLKGAVLPSNYREYIFETFNLSPEHIYQMYGMQEINSNMPRCKAGRYHVPPWVICLLLDRGGDNLLPQTDGEKEGRAAFFDLALDGRWGGVISGDKIQVDTGTCACGNRSPSIRDNITRFADLPDGDKISCSGTIDAYVRGVA